MDSVDRQGFVLAAALLSWRHLASSFMTRAVCFMKWGFSFVWKHTVHFLFHKWRQTCISPLILSWIMCNFSICFSTNFKGKTRKLCSRLSFFHSTVYLSVNTCLFMSILELGRVAGVQMERLHVHCKCTLMHGSCKVETLSL